MALLRLAYVSTSAIAGDPRERESIADILMSSRRNNETAGITGALLATDDRFAQVLEGEQETVEETYARITRDRCHVDIVLLLKEPVAPPPLRPVGCAWPQEPSPALELKPSLAITSQRSARAESRRASSVPRKTT
ncbi:MAG: BLUF domain-containing protein [Methyloceanibacter sp.]|uniref:BLUF domain-containing protein n=1 Tax=Methyloceanibacter sp. TaxID=1965321 RepID=UPI003EE4103F